MPSSTNREDGTSKDSDPSFRMPRKLPTSAAAGIASGVVAGFAVGAVAGPHGVALGFVLGLAVGWIAGKVIEKDERLRVRRTRELDAIIGVTEGSLGAGSVSLVPTEHLEPRSHEEGERWLSEFLTPPPPAAA